MERMNEMDFLSLLNSVKEDVLIKRHPLADEDLSLRFAYAVGVGMSAIADGPLNESEQAALEELAAGLLIPEEQVAKVLFAAATPDKSTITSVLGALTKREEQYLFLLDLRAMANKDGVADEKEQKAIEQFAAMFKMSGAEMLLWRELDEAVFARDFDGSEAGFLKMYTEKKDDVNSIAGLEAYRSLVYFWQSETIVDKLATIEMEILVVKEECKKATKEPMDITFEYFKKSHELNNALKGFANAASFLGNRGGSSEIVKISAEEAWDKVVNDKKKQIKAKIAPCITALETRRDLLAAAIDSIYINNEI